MVSPERRACSRAAASDFSDGSMPATVAPSAASVSARMPPPHPTARTRLAPNPPNTRRKYSTRTAFSSCSPANGPASLHHTPGTRSTRRSYFSGSERPPRRGSWSLMNRESTARRGLVEVGGRWWRMVGVVMQERFSRLYHFAARWALLSPFRPPPTSSNLPNLPQPPSGSRLHVRERGHVEEPQARQARVLVHLDQQQVADADDAGHPLAPHADMQHRLGLVLLHGEGGVHLDRRDPRLRLLAREHDACVLGRLRDGKVVAGANVVRPSDDVHAADATAGDVDHDERAVAALQVHGPVEPRRLPDAFAGDGEDVGFLVPAIAHLGQLTREWLDPCFERHRGPAFQPSRRAGNIGRTMGRS